MNSRIVARLSLVLMCDLVGCTQPSGEIRQPEGEEINKVDDLQRDLANVWNRSEGAMTELVDDLGGLAPVDPPLPATQVLANSIGACFKTPPPSKLTAQQVARHLFTVMNNRELNRRQVREVQEAVREVLGEAGADQIAVARVSASIEDVQASITANRRRWWHLF